MEEQAEFWNKNLSKKLSQGIEGKGIFIFFQLWWLFTTESD
jgi:hypothetical protein